MAFWGFSSSHRGVFGGAQLSADAGGGGRHGGCHLGWWPGHLNPTNFCSSELKCLSQRVVSCPAAGLLDK